LFSHPRVTGGFGVISQCEFKNGDVIELFALKEEKIDSAEYVAKCTEAELKRLAVFQGDPNIVSLRGVACDNNRVTGLLLRWVDGLTLRKKLSDTDFSDSQRLTVVQQLAAVMKRIHDKKVIHRDLTPTNVMLEGRDLRVVLIDFGLAREEGKDVNITSHPTAGTVRYVAPEAKKGSVTSKMDVFAFGMILNEVLGRAKWFDRSEKGKIIPHSKPASLVTIYRLSLSCVETEPEKRPDFSEIYDALIHTVVDGKVDGKGDTAKA